MSIGLKRQWRPLLSGLSAAIALALYTGSAFAAAPADAQDAAAKPADQAAASDESTDDTTKAKPKQEDEETLEQVVVTYTASLAKALDLKRDTSGQVDVIVAEDIGKFPDLNLAESLQRIPGVSIQRDAGEGRQISVRGLDPTFTRVRINGMEALSTAGGTDSSGGANRGRGFDFNVFASELFSNLTVHKTASADIDEGSLGTTVDLTVARPFDYDGFTFVAGGQEGYNDLSKDWDPRASALISNTFADGRFGALMSVAYTKRHLVEEGHSTVRWDNGTSSGGFAASSPFAAARLPTTFHPRIPRYGVLGHEQERLGVTGSLQFQPNDATNFTLDALFADFDATRTEDFLEALSFSRTGQGKPQTIVREGFVSPVGSLDYGLFDNVDVRSESRYDELETKFTQFTLSGDHQFSDTFRISGLFGHAKSELDNPIQTTITIDRVDADGYSYDYRNDSRLPLITYGFDVNDPASWAFANNLSEIRLRPQFAGNTFDTGSLNFEWSPNYAITLKGGLQYKKYEFESSELRRASELAVPALPAGTNLSSLLRTVRLNGGLDLPNGSATTWLAPDISAFDQLFDIYSNSGVFTLATATALANNRSVTETDKGGFLQLDFNTEIGNVPLRGDVGLRHVRTGQESTGFAIVNGAARLTTVDRDYNDTLPSLNLVAELRDDFLVRFGAAKVMSRPGLGNLTPGVTVSVSGGSRTVTGGDPFLEPFHAKTADLAFEWYFDENSLLSLALFYKDLDTFVQTSRETRPYNSSGLPEELLAGTGASPTDDFQFNIPINTPGGALRGVEINYQQPLSFLPHPFDDLGLLLNYTYVESDIQYLTSTGATSLRTDLTGLSKNAYNATLYYERDKFSARVSAAYRDEYLTTVPGRNNNNVEGTKSTLNLDFSSSYQFNDNLEFILEALNLTDEFNDQWVDSVADRASVYHHTGRQYYLGVRYRF